MSKTVSGSKRPKDYRVIRRYLKQSGFSSASSRYYYAVKQYRLEHRGVSLKDAVEIVRTATPRLQRLIADEKAAYYGGLRDENVKLRLHNNNLIAAVKRLIKYVPADGDAERDDRDFAESAVANQKVEP
jgi:hypothetical protein